jgi:acetoin utilization protein AcuB
MTRDPSTVSPDTMLLDAYMMMRNYDIRRLPVMQDERLVGILTLSDIRSIVHLGLFRDPEETNVLANTPVSSVMTQHPVTISPDDSVANAARIMFENKFGGLPVVKGGRMVGIISESDLFRVVMVEADGASE